jgi:hypothetical protein
VNRSCPNLSGSIPTNRIAVAQAGHDSSGRIGPTGGRVGFIASTVRPNCAGSEQKKAAKPGQVGGEVAARLGGEGVEGGGALETRGPCDRSDYRRVSTSFRREPEGSTFILGAGCTGHPVLAIYDNDSRGSNRRF